MKVSKEDNNNQRAYLITTNNNDIALIDGEGLVMASSSAKIIGNHIIIHSLPDLEKSEKSTIKNFSKNGSRLLAQNIISSADNNILFELFISNNLLGDIERWSSTDQFIKKLTSQDKLSDDTVAQFENDAQILGYNLGAERSAILFELTNFYKKILSTENGENKEKIINLWKKRIINALKSFFTQNHDMIVSYLGEDKF